MTASQQILSRAVQSVGDPESINKTPTASDVLGQASQTITRTIRDLPAQIGGSFDTAVRELGKLPGELGNGAAQFNAAIVDPVVEWYNKSPWARAVERIAEEELDDYLTDKVLTSFPGSFGAAAKMLENIGVEVFGASLVGTYKVVSIGYRVWEAEIEIETEDSTRALELDYEFGEATFGNSPDSAYDLGLNYDLFGHEDNYATESLGAEIESSAENGNQDFDDTDYGDDYGDDDDGDFGDGWDD